jgi:transcription antitermination factor NusG
MSKPVMPGQIVTINGGKYHGHGAEIKKIHADRVEVLIAGKIVHLKMERVSHGT